MSTYSYQEADQHLAQILEEAKNSTVMISNPKGEMFSVQFIPKATEKLTPPNLTHTEIVSYIREMRERDTH